MCVTVKIVGCVIEDIKIAERAPNFYKQGVSEDLYKLEA